jgi:acyl-CoA synthetase (NDP forming)
MMKEGVIIPHMIILEHEAKQLLKSAGLPVPASQVIYTPDEAQTINGAVVLKAQVPIGGPRTPTKLPRLLPNYSK